jgi:hypothetical protein
MARDDRPTGDDVVEDVMSAPGAPEVRRDRREHGGGGMPGHVDDDALAERTEQERVELGLDDYDPDDVPPATDDPVPTDLTESEEYQQERTEIEVEIDKGVLPSGGQRPEFPPTSYPDN